MRELIVARHAHSLGNEADVVSGRPPGAGLSARGREEAARLGVLLAGVPIELGFATRFLRTRETLELALAGRDVPSTTLPELDEIAFGSYEGGPLSAYRTWAWTEEPDVRAPGGGESRADAAARIADGLDLLLARREGTILLVSHALPVRYVLDAADGSFPAARITPVANAEPARLERRAVERAAEALRTWSEDPQFRDPDGDAGEG